MQNLFELYSVFTKDMKQIDSHMYVRVKLFVVLLNLDSNLLAKTI